MGAGRVIGEADGAPRSGSFLVGPLPLAGGSPRASRDRTISLLLVVIALLPGLLMAVGYLKAMADTSDVVEPFSDAITYLAAGERLNAGHDLYRLGPGDRGVLLLPQTGDVPLVSPPPIAVLWRPLAAVPFGFPLWIAATWVVLLVTVVRLVLRTGALAVIACVVLFDAIAQQLSVANVAAFFPALLVLAWDRRREPWTGALTGAMTALKMSPGTGFGWLVGQRDWRRLIWAVGGLLGLALVGLIGAGVQPWFDYLDVARRTQPSPESLAGLTGIPWLSSAVLVGGTLAAAMIRRDRWSFGIAVVASVMGSPALYHAGYIPLLVLTVPVAEVLRERAGRAAGTRGDLPDRTISDHDGDRSADLPAGVQP
jgi:hypothetical protein